MKTAEELFNEQDWVRLHLDSEPMVTISAVENIIKEHDNEIIELIDDMESDERPDLDFSSWEIYTEGFNKALTELKRKIQQ